MRQHNVDIIVDLRVSTMSQHNYALDTLGTCVECVDALDTLGTCVDYESLLQNIVSFIGLFCKRDLSF